MFIALILSACAIAVLLVVLILVGVSIMGILQDMQAELVEINETTNGMAEKIVEVASDVDDLIGKMPQAGGILEADAQALKLQLDSLKSKLGGMNEQLSGVANKWTPEVAPVEEPPVVKEPPTE